MLCYGVDGGRAHRWTAYKSLSRMLKFVGSLINVSGRGRDGDRLNRAQSHHGFCGVSAAFKHVYQDARARHGPENPPKLDEEVRIGVVGAAWCFREEKILPGLKPPGARPFSLPGFNSTLLE